MNVILANQLNEISFSRLPWFHWDIAFLLRFAKQTTRGPGCSATGAPRNSRSLTASWSIVCFCDLCNHSPPVASFSGTGGGSRAHSTPRSHRMDLQELAISSLKADCKHATFKCFWFQYNLDSLLSSHAIFSTYTLVM